MEVLSALSQNWQWAEVLPERMLLFAGPALCPKPHRQDHGCRPSDITTRVLAVLSDSVLREISVFELKTDSFQYRTAER
ncbi:Hypothetical predicted protein [Lynx pardinus]|uniref:Uncharacterized protein n=1 Tax=Lynx pardinus TaxID=191816 RepID=A0A485PKS8_LYNPA|nr:Hypothetical predicted protein [Lynx pardinus]